ncbi:MAG: alpha/beta hydrolase [Saprospiraceae bacterium]|nr:alpha/beta hydrolase [Saprospiraceae bacterium]
MQSYQIAIEGRPLFFRTLGEGPALLLFHASPSSSAMLIPLMEALAEHFLVLAPDTPGYGQSMGLSQKPSGMRSYAKVMRRLTEELGLTHIGIYGTATGAQLGIRYALDYPDQVSHLFLDNAAHFTERQREEILQSYFPDISPKSDGSHLMTVWTMVRDLFTFFPWCFDQVQYRLPTGLPPASILHKVALDYLVAGTDYHLAYRAAFQHEKAAFVQDLSCPTTIFNWTGSIVQAYIQQLIQQGLPQQVSVHDVATADRISTMAKHILEKWGGGGKAENIDFRQCEVASPAAALAMDLPTLEVDAHGGHLMKAWFYLRDQQVQAKEVADGNRLIQAEELHKQLVRWFQTEAL